MSMSFRQLADIMRMKSLGFTPVEKKSLTKASKIVVAEAKSMFGVYQPGWPSLKDETILRKSEGDTPLLETGKLRDSIAYKVDDHEAWVGSTDKKMIFSEQGTRHEPPRPVLEAAARNREAEVRQIIGDDIYNYLRSRAHG